MLTPSVPLAANPRRPIERLFRLCASLPLAVGLVAALAIALALGTWLESRVGAAAARVHVYHSVWFRALLTLLAINVMASALIRYPWTRQQAGFVITHIGIEILLAGSLIGSRFGFEAQLHLAPGQSTDTVQLETDRLLVAVPDAEGKPVGYEIPFDPWSKSTWTGRWPAGFALPLPAAGAAKITVTNWLPSAKVDPSDAGAFVEAPVLPADLPRASKAVCVSIDSEGQQVSRWIAQGTLGSVDIPAGTMQLAYAPAVRTLPFDLSIAKIRRAISLPNEPVGYEIDVVFNAPNGAVSRQSVEVNQPASFEGVSVFAGGVEEHNAQATTATLDLRADPGRSLKYIGGSLIIAGTVGVFVFGAKRPPKRQSKTSARRGERTLVTAAA